MSVLAVCEGCRLHAPRDLSGTLCTNYFRSVSFSSLMLAKYLACSRRSRFPFGFFQVFSTSKWSLDVCHILPRDSKGRFIAGVMCVLLSVSPPTLVLASHGPLATVSLSVVASHHHCCSRQTSPTAWKCCSRHSFSGEEGMCYQGHCHVPRNATLLCRTTRGVTMGNNLYVNVLLSRAHVEGAYSVGSDQDQASAYFRY